MVTRCTIVTITLLATPSTVQSGGTRVSTHSALPARRALADPCHRVAVPVVLAEAGVGAVGAVLARGAGGVTQSSLPPSVTGTGS